MSSAEGGFQVQNTCKKSTEKEFIYEGLCFSRDSCAAGRHSERMDRKERTEETVQTRTTYAGAAQSLREAKAEKGTNRGGKKIEGEERQHTGKSSSDTTQHKGAATSEERRDRRWRQTEVQR